MPQNAPPGGDECSDFKNPIGRTFLSGNRIFAETGKSRLSVKPRPVGGELHFLALEEGGSGSLFDQPAISQKIASMRDRQREIDLLLHNEEGEPFLIHLLKR